MPIVPDDKNWTWVLERPCSDCGFDASKVAASDVAALLADNVAAWGDLLAREHVRLRPSDDQWSALEYGCHIRDVLVLFDERLRLMLTEDEPRFVNWDQDVTAIEQRYDLQDPVIVAGELQAAGAVMMNRLATIGDADWSRRGLRSDGAVFTIESFVLYFLHDPVHHVDDVRRGFEILEAGALDT